MDEYNEKPSQLCPNILISFDSTRRLSCSDIIEIIKLDLTPFWIINECLLSYSVLSGCQMWFHECALMEM